MSEAPVTLDHPRGRTWLKWHRGRRRASDMEFDTARILEGMALGASVEIDIRRHADGGFAVLHEETLERTTTGTGYVATTRAQDLRSLRRRGNDGQATGQPVALLEDLCGALGTITVGEGALLQLDLKETSDALSEADIRGFVQAVGPVQEHAILSGGDPVAVNMLAQALPLMQIGHDPCHFGAREALMQSRDDRGFVARALREAGNAKLIYLDIRLILDALARDFDMIAAFHAEGRRIDAYTIQSVTEETARVCARLTDLNVDQITTDDPEGLHAMCSGALPVS